MNSITIVHSGNEVKNIAVIVNSVIVKYIYTSLGLDALKENWYIISRLCNVEGINDRSD